MVDVSHDDAVAVLKATQERVVLTVEKNAIASVAPPAEKVSQLYQYIYQQIHITVSVVIVPLPADSLYHCLQEVFIVSSLHCLYLHILSDIKQIHI